MIRRGKAQLLIREDYKDLLLQQGIDHFQAYLKRRAQPSAHFRGRRLHLSAPLEGGKRIVIRHYSHGGLIRFLTRDLFLSGSRAFEELSFTDEIRKAGIPTVEPVGAVQESIFPFFYRAYLLTIEIAGAMDLTQFLGEPTASDPRERLKRKRGMIRSVGEIVQRFHRAGFFHRDLQLKNILIAEARPFLIDFDRSYRKTHLSRREKLDNLLRLNRSVEKWKRNGLPITRTDRWRFFLAYSGRDPSIREAFKDALLKEAPWYRIHRMAWNIKKRTELKA